MKVEPYAWSWAAAAFLDNHPRYRERFRRLPKFVDDADFNRRFAETFSSDAAQLAEEWQVFISDIAYGYDFCRTQIDFRAGVKLPAASGAKLTVAADRGWQNTGVRLEAGKAYDCKPAGGIRSAKSRGVWWSEPNGVSIHSFTASRWACCWRPFVRTTRPRHKPVSHAAAAGLSTVIRPTHSGTLYLRVNVSDGELDSAAGTLWCM